MEQKLDFSWNAERGRLERTPHCPTCTRDESMKYAAMVKAMRGEDLVARETARYTMAMVAYEQRDWFLPCRSVPGGPMPRFLDERSNSTFQSVREGLRMLAGSSNANDQRRIKDKFPEAERAAMFLEYVERVSAVESHNESCCRTLLMANAVLTELNPSGDAAAIEIIRGILRIEYNIAEPALDHRTRHIQARQVARSPRWLSGAWRAVWERP